MDSAAYQTQGGFAPIKTDGQPDRAYLTAMAEAVNQDSKQKRKRGNGDMTHQELRRTKRGAAATATMAISNHDVDAGAFAESAVEALQVNNVNTLQAPNVNTVQTSINVNTTGIQDGFRGLQQVTADHSEPSDAVNASSTAAAALGMPYPSIHVPPSTEETFAAQIAEEDAQAQARAQAQQTDGSYEANDMHMGEGLPGSAGAAHSSPEDGVRSGRTYSGNHSKPAVGSEEWHKLRKDNHKEVERRRRETINEGINELSKIVPGCEKNKGSILQRTVSFITQLKENEAQNIEKWTLEKLLTEQAIQELSSANDKLKQECERAYQEMSMWKQLSQSHGLDLSHVKEDPASSS